MSQTLTKGSTYVLHLNTTGLIYPGAENDAAAAAVSAGFPVSIAFASTGTDMVNIVFAWIGETMDGDVVGHQIADAVSAMGILATFNSLDLYAAGSTGATITDPNSLWNRFLAWLKQLIPGMPDLGKWAWIIFLAIILLIFVAFSAKGFGEGMAEKV